MSKQVYNLWRVTRCEDGTNRREWRMIASLTVIGDFLRLRRDAEERVVWETKNGGVCQLFHGAQGIWHEVERSNGVVPAVSLHDASIVRD